MKTLRCATAIVALLLATADSGLRAEPQGPDASGLSRFSVAPIDVNYSSTPVRGVLDTLAEIGGVNVFVESSVPDSATISMRFRQVPWNVVMDTILKSSGLTYELDGNLLRVLSREARTKELDDQARQKKAGEAAPDLVTVTHRLNYASAAIVSKLMSDAHLKSDRGSVDFVERTNTLIIKDLPKNIAEMEALLGDMDRPEPQVEIEAKIVSTSSDTAHALGVKWGFNGRAAPELGNTTGLGFPNRGTVGGRVGAQQQGPTDPRSTPLDQTQTAVNLAAPGATTALGFAMGGVNGALGLDLELSALAHNGKAEILSTPRVTTQNNKEAVIKQGFQVPIQMVTNNTITVTFKDAALVLTVTPQITAANTVIMKIQIENNEPDFSRAVNGNPSINTQSAITQVQVSDGLTTVIGGILKSTKTINNDETPGASKIPVLGKLFKRTDKRTESNELLIFITPRIIRG